MSVGKAKAKPKPEPLVGAEPVAKFLGETETTVYRWARRGVIPSVSITNKTRKFQFSAVVAAIEAKKAG